MTSADTIERVGIREFRGNLANFLHRVRSGHSLLITSNGEVVAEVHPPVKAQKRPRVPGALQGKIRIAPDFDELPHDLLEAMENGEE